jgi:hypothetical protein
MEERNHLKNLGIDGRTLQWILEKRNKGREVD